MRKFRGIIIIVLIIALSTSFASAYSKSGSVTIASMKQTADSGTSVTYGIKPTASSFWSYQSLIVPTGTKNYFSYYGNMNKVFYYSLVETLYITFSVPNTYFAINNASLSLTVGASN